MLCQCAHWKSLGLQPGLCPAQCGSPGGRWRTGAKIFWEEQFLVLDGTRIVRMSPIHNSTDDVLGYSTVHILILFSPLTQICFGGWVSLEQYLLILLGPSFLYTSFLLLGEHCICLPLGQLYWMRVLCNGLSAHLPLHRQIQMVHSCFSLHFFETKMPVI